MGIVAKVQKLGRIAIPKPYRDLYNLHEGDIVEIEIIRVKHEDGTVIDFSQEAMSNGQ